MIKDVLKYLQPNAAIPIDMETTTALVNALKEALAQRTEQRPVAWYDPSNGVVSTDRDSPLFTPLGQVWPLSLEREWVGLTDKERFEIRIHSVQNMGENFQETLCKAIEAKLKEKNT